MSDQSYAVLFGLGIALIVAAFCAYYSARLAREKNRDVTLAIVLGLSLGLLGVLIVALLPSKQNRAQ